MLSRFTRRAAVIAALLSLFVLTACGSGSGEPAATGDTGAGSAPTGPVVETRGLEFVPNEITVKVGDTVTWRNTDGIAHTVTFGTYEVDAAGNRTSETPSGAFDERLAGEGATVSRTFTEAGEFPYYCRPHQAMNARVIVTP